MHSEELIKQAWESKSLKQDDAGFELCLREIIREYRLGDLSKVSPVIMLDTFADAIAAFTRRGKP